MEFFSHIDVARQRNTLPDAIADIFIERNSLNLATTREDLTAAGLTDVEIDQNLAAARKAAAARCIRRIKRAA